MFPVVPIAAAIAAVVVGRKLILRKFDEMRSRPTRVLTPEVDSADSAKVTLTLDPASGEWIVVGGAQRSAPAQDSATNPRSP